MSFTDTFAYLDVEFPVPNNLDIDCIAVGSALIWHPRTWETGPSASQILRRGWGGGGGGWSEHFWPLGLSLSCLRA